MWNLLGLGPQQPGELPLESHTRVALDDRLPDCVGYLVAAPEHIDCCTGGKQEGFGAGFNTDARRVMQGNRVRHALASSFWYVMQVSELARQCCAADREVDITDAGGQA